MEIKDLDEVGARKAAMHPLLSSYIGGHRSSLPTPSLCLSLPAIQRNCDIFHKSLDGTGIQFRAHVKTHKTAEVTRIKLGTEHHAVIVSTVREMRGLLPLIQDGTITDVLYGLPPAASYIPTLSSLSRQIPNLRLLVDHPDQLKDLTALPPLCGKHWSVFLKIDTGCHRAGLEPNSEEFFELCKAALVAKNVSIYGLYAHAGDSYSSHSEEDSQAYLSGEVTAVTDAMVTLQRAAAAISADLAEQVAARPYVLSVGATPTAHVVGVFRSKTIGEGFPLLGQCQFEIHAGNFPFNDLQQLATGVVPEPDRYTPGSSSLACTVQVEVVSIYPSRNEALINAGVLAVGREPGQYPGFARVRGREKWVLGRVSQEHGVLSLNKDEAEGGSDKIEKAFKVGEKLTLDVQHACVTAASHDWYFVLDEKDIVKDVWYPWRGWM
ncbi:hypothetical protein DRE_01102 [Drechslerella stenobrocha 248]|uniref:D-serine dehydratase n=1 Tax=Drechslerella stenobrocha 248 TaxID=1043628 RepID=W7HJX2_9PEZI|nr:hypothetical protein DRE_01102 [Drechslerella stenobrocha 248]